MAAQSSQVKSLAVLGIASLLLVAAIFRSDTATPASAAPRAPAPTKPTHSSRQPNLDRISETSIANPEEVFSQISCNISTCSNPDIFNNEHDVCWPGPPTYWDSLANGPRLASPDVGTTVVHRYFAL